MNTRILFILLIWLAKTTGVAAQSLPLTNEAARLCQEKKYTEAKATIEKAINSTDEGGDAYAWYVRGYIYKEIYKEKEQQLRNSEYRETSVISFEKCITIEPAGKYDTMARTALKYLATTYFNDALKRTREIDRNNEKDPEVIFTRFTEVMKLADPGTSLKEYETELWKSLAQSHYKLWQKNTADIYHANRSAEFYQMVLRENPADCEAGFNLAILFYNQGVYKIRMIDSGTDISQLIMIQDESIRLFRESMPYASTSFESCPKKIEHYKALMYINRALGREDIYEQLLLESEELVKQGKLKN
ncbi:MAG: hypothetical protein IT223_07425 [Crocinitomicaceae bacterium]|nr:hypothetical protein [Crocinitomicaceae bacterium]